MKRVAVIALVFWALTGSARADVIDRLCHCAADTCLRQNGFHPEYVPELYLALYAKCEEIVLADATRGLYRACRFAGRQGCRSVFRPHRRAYRRCIRGVFDCRA